MYNVEIVIEPASQIRAEAVQMLSKAFGKKPDPDIWQWKHENNPFGQSRVIVARKKNQIVGLRPIWVSPIIYANKQIDAVQFVDSAVIETERGKGLFRDMCAQALGEIKDSLVFHTPNQMSYPAYMKMGWCNVGGLVRCWQPLSISAILKYLMKKYHFSSIKSDGNISEKLEDYSAVHESLPEGVEGLLAATAISLGNQVGIQRSMAWIKWRTGLPDGTRFFYFSYGNDVIIIFYIVEVIGLKCIRVLDVLADFSNTGIMRKATRHFLRLAGKTCQFISVICSESHPFLKYIQRFVPIRRESVNFVVNTSRLTSLDQNIFLNPENWALTQSAMDFN